MVVIYARGSVRQFALGVCREARMEDVQVVSDADVLLRMVQLGKVGSRALL